MTATVKSLYSTPPLSDGSFEAQAEKAPGEIAAFSSDSERWLAVLRRDKTASGRFVFAVKTTGVYCQSGCSARLARRENVAFYPTPADAEAAGFRACKRCAPNQDSVRDPLSSQRVRAVEKVCQMIRDEVQTPDLAALAAAVGLSSSHFRRVFKATTGLTPKAYVVAQRSRRVRDELVKSETVTAAIYSAGFGSNGRFYDTSAGILGMRPSDYRAGGDGATIRFAVGQCALGAILVARSEIGICAITLGDDPSALVEELQDRFPKAEIVGGDHDFERLVAKVVAFVERPSVGLGLPLDIRGTAFQQRVWQKLSEIPSGQTRTYSQVARELGLPKATRAVASACAANKIAVAIPCHRVVRTDGTLSGYRWGIERKAKLLETERTGK